MTTSLQDPTQVDEKLSHSGQNQLFNWKHSAVLFVICILCYSNSTNCDLVFDDISAVKDNKDLRPSQPLSNLLWNDFWGTPMSKENSHKSYRPFTVLTFRWNYGIHGFEPFGYHFINLVLHALNSLLVYRCFCFLSSEIAAFVGALLFAVHPIHTEAVTGVVGRAELLSTAFSCGIFILYVSCNKKDILWKIASPLLLVLALFSKEQGITIVAICVLYELFIFQKMTVEDILRFTKGIFQDKPKSNPAVINAIRNLWIILVSSILLMAWRFNIMKGQLPVFTPFDNPASVSAFPVKQMTYLYLLALNTWLLIFPWSLLCDYTMGTVPLVQSIFDERNLATTVFLLVMGKLCTRAVFSKCANERKILIMALSWMVFPFLPASNLLFPVGFVVAERILYMPSVGFCLLIAYGFDGLKRKISKKSQKQYFLYVAIALTLITWGYRTYVRNVEWKTESSLFRSALRITQTNAKVFNNIGHALEKTNELSEALDFFKSAALVQPDDIGAWNNVGRTLNQLNRTQEAEAAWRRAKELLPQPKPGQQYQTRIAPQHLNVFLNLGNIMAKDPLRLEEADQLYRQAISMRNDYVEAYINRGDVLLKLNRSKDAVEVYQKALQIDSTNADIYYNLAVVYTDQGRSEEAIQYFEKCLAKNPDHQLALLNSAILMSELKNSQLYDDIQWRLEKVTRMKDDPNAYFQLGLLMMDRKQPLEAEKYFLKTVKLKEDHKSGLFNAALLLNNRQEPMAALEHLLHLIKVYPDYIKAWILIGDIYINGLKDFSKAETAYREILQYEPANFQAAHNLCVTFIEQGKLPEADQCMAELANLMRDDQQYLATHFRTIHDRLQRRKQAASPVSAPVFN